MATKSTTNNKKPDITSDAYLGQPIDRKGKTLNDEQAKTFNRYTHWKNNLMCLYNHIETFGLPYPARTVQFLPNSKQNISPKNQYNRYTNCPFIYPSYCSVPKQEMSSHQTQSNATDDSRLCYVHSINPCTQTHKQHKSMTHRSPKMTPIFFLQSVNYFVANRMKEQEALYNLFHSDTNNQSHLINFCDIASIKESNVITGILPYDAYMHGGASVESAYDVYRLRIMPQEPHLIATRSYHEDIAVYWLDYNHLPRPLNAFNKRRKRNVIPERSGLSMSDDENDSECDDEDMVDTNMSNNNNQKKRKRKYSNSDAYPTKKQKLSHNDATYYDNDNDAESDSDSDGNDMDIEVGTGHGYLIAVGQTSSKTRTGWGLSFNPQHAGMFITGNSDGSIACWDLNMIDNAQCMTKHGKYKNKKHSADPNVYMKDSKIHNKSFNDGPPFITRQHPDEYHWFEEFEKYGIWNHNSSTSSTTNADIMSVDWCHDSSNIFASSSANGQISIWDRRSKQVKKKPVLWTWGTSHNQSILSISWNPIQHSLIASGDKASKVRIWDVRSFNRHIVQLSQHKAPVYHVKWCPYNKYLIASSSSDRMLLMYDLRRSGLNKPKMNENSNNEENGINNEQSNVKTESVKGGKDGIDSISKLLDDLSTNSYGKYGNSLCPELVFAHCGHTACIPEFDWCPSGDLTMISTDMDGIIQTWQPPSGMLNTFAWVLHSKKREYTMDTTN